jgi:hypothetical protein
MDAANRDSVSQVRTALVEAVGEKKADYLLKRRSRFLEGMTPEEFAQVPGGAKVVLMELPKIAISAR